MRVWVCGSMVEHQTDNLKVEGSIPSTPTKMTESTQEYNPLQEARDAIASARERIDEELKRDLPIDETPRTWFGCYVTVASTVAGSLELAGLMGKVTGSEAEALKSKAQILLDRIKQINEENSIHQVNQSPQLQEELLEMLDVFKEK